MPNQIKPVVSRILIVIAFLTAFYRAADGQLMKKTESLIVEAKP